MNINGKVANHTVMEIIGVLERAVREARAGRLRGIVLITASDAGSLGCTIAGSAQISDLYLGAGMAQQQLIQLLQNKPVPIADAPEGIEIIEERIGPTQ